MINILYKVTIKTQTPFNISTGVKNDSFVKNLSVRDVDNKPYIPGSTIKGRIRDNFRKLVGNDKTDKLFGNEHIFASSIYVDNFYLLGDDYNSNIRFGNTIDRDTRTAKDKALYSKEVISGEFFGEIEASFNENEIDKDDILVAIKMISSIGGSKSTGLGKVNIIVEEVI